MDFFYPLPNQGAVKANGYGVFQQFVPQTAAGTAANPDRS